MRLLLATLVLLAPAREPLPSPTARQPTRPPNTSTTTAAPLGPEGARHLLVRTGFGASPAEVDAFARLSAPAAIERLLAGLRTSPVTPPPAWTTPEPATTAGSAARGDMPGASDDAGAEAPRSPPGPATPRDNPSRRNAPRGTPAPEPSAAERRARQQLLRERGEELKEWWVRELLATDSAFTERLVLFWHNHFTSSLRKVRAPLLLWRQQEHFRRHAAGNFRELTRVLVTDPALMVYLDAGASRRNQPNENLARELLELFTLGEGHYTEHDIREAARALTGWRIDRQSGTARFVPAMHDRGTKQFLGKTDAFDANGIVTHIFTLERPALFLVEKLWREFVSDTPEAAEVRRLAEILRHSDYELKPLLVALFTSPHFLAESARGTLIKSPVDLLVGTARTFALPLPDPQVVARASRSLGQDLFDPPNVKGWPGGAHWIGASTLLARALLLETLVEVRPGRARPGAIPGPGPEHFATWYASLAPNDAARAARARMLLAPITPVEVLDPATQPDAATVLRHLLLDPVYQLK